MPTYISARSEDHIVPMEGGLPHGARLLGKASARSCSAPRGHIAGVINPPSKNKRSLLDRRQAAGRSATPGSTGAKEHPGSWWTDWAALAQARHAGKQIAAPKALGKAQVQADRARARPLRQGEGLSVRSANTAVASQPVRIIHGASMEASSSSPPPAPPSASSAARSPRSRRPNSAPSSSRRLLARAKRRSRPGRRSHHGPGADRGRGQNPARQALIKAGLPKDSAGR